MNVEAECAKCGAVLAAADDTPDDQMVTCGSCGSEIGTYGQIREAMILKGRSEIESRFAKMIEDANKRLK